MEPEEAGDDTADSGPAEQGPVHKKEAEAPRPREAPLPLEKAVKPAYDPPARNEMIEIEAMLREEKDLEEIAEKIIEGTFLAIDIQKKDSIEKFLDFVLLKIRTGIHYIPSLAYPSKRIADPELEEKIIELINVHLFPDIIIRLLKYFVRNIHDSDTNLYLAYLITSDEIITSIYNTFLTFKKDVFEPDRQKKTLNVKRMQQFSPRSDDRFSSPLDTACRFKYILEFIALVRNVDHIYTKEMISLSGGE